MRKLLLRNADALIFDRGLDEELRSIFGSLHLNTRCHFNFTTFCEFDCIHQQIQKHLLQPATVELQAQILDFGKVIGECLLVRAVQLDNINNLKQFLLQRGFFKLWD